MISNSVLLAAAVLVSIAISFSVLATREPMDEYDQWKEQFHIELPQEENYYRRTIFQETLKRIAEHNSASGSTYRLGLNQFAALTNQQFEKIYLTLKSNSSITKQPEVSLPTAATIDWQAKGVVSPVKNQGSCSASYAFSAIGCVQGVYAIAHKNTVEYSVQQVIDCSYGFGNNGCFSGILDKSLQYVNERGINTAVDYPFRGQAQSCILYYGKFKIGSFFSESGCTALSNALSKAPVAAMVSATNWKDYHSGVFSNCDKNLNAAVLVTGMTDEFWRAKNSWGIIWGESGYIRISKSSDCGICEQIAYAGI